MSTSKIIDAYPVQAEKPEGGFCNVTTTQIYMAWWVYNNAKHIQKRDLHVWLAAWEMQKRRQVANSRKKPHYDLKELHGLVGGVGGEHLRASIRRLEGIGLVTIRPTTVHFAKTPEELHLNPEARKSLTGKLQAIQNRHRLIPMPRRMIRYLASGPRK